MVPIQIHVLQIPAIHPNHPSLTTHPSDEALKQQVQLIPSLFLSTVQNIKD